MLFSSPAFAAQGTNVPARVTEVIDPEKCVVLQGNTHPLARPEFDQGAVPDSLPVRRILLVLRRSPEQEAELRHLLDEQQTKSSPNFHQWLTPEEFGQRFGPADADIQAVTDWLASEGFEVSRVAAGRTVIEFSGTAGQVRQAFHTEIHKFVVSGEEHLANASDPQIPAALAPVVTGFASLNNFPRKPMIRRLGTFQRSKATGEVRPLFTFSPSPGTTLYGVGPTDFATIYNVAPLWNASVDGTGQTVAIVGRTDINIQDVRDFRSMFGLPAKDPNIIHNGPDPGIIPAEETEADLDVQWSGAVAKGATIDFVVSESTEVSDGVDLSAFYIIDNNLAPVMSYSFGLCELFNGTAGNAFYSGLWEEAAAQGITVMIAAGDSGSAGCDPYPPSEIAASFGAMVSGTASTPFNVAVGGTDFNDYATWSAYWNSTNNSTTQSSAKSYIPETTWNDTCAGTGLLTACSSPASDGTDLVGGSGGPSNCAESTVTATGYSCTGAWAKPSWQTGAGVPNDGVRDIPDVSLFASDGFNGSFYVICEMDANSGTGSSTTSCDLNAPYTDFLGVGGTSASSPAFAGIMALVVQKTGQRQGNANYVLYKLAAKSGASCTSNPSAVGNSSCIFYDVNNKTSSGNQSNNSVACYAATPNCSNQTSSGYGILVVNPGVSPQVPAWNTGAGYDLATGLGSVNAANLVNDWSSVSFTASKTTLSLSTTPPTSPVTVTHGQSVNVSISVAPASGTGTPTGDVSLIAQVSNSGGNSSTTAVGGYTLSGGSVSSTTNFLPGGTYGVTAHYAGDGTFGASDSSPAVQVKVSPESSKALVGLVIYDASTEAFDIYGTSAPYGSPYWLRVDVTNSSGTECSTSTTPIPCPTGQVTLTDNGSPLDLGTYALNEQGYLEEQYPQLPGGSNSVVANYGGDISYNASTSGTVAMSITPASTTTTLSAPSSAKAGASVTLTAGVTTNTTYYGAVPGGKVTFFNGTTQIGSPVTVTGTPFSPTTGAPATATASLITSFTATASVTAQYSGDTNYTGSTSPASTITVTTAPDFNFSASPTSLTVTAGNSGTSTLTITPLSGFTGTVTLTCSGAPAGATCSASPSSVTVSGTSAVTSTLTITTTGSVVPVAAVRTLPPRGSEPYDPLRREPVPPGGGPPSIRLKVGLPWLAAGLLGLAMLMSLLPISRRGRRAILPCTRRYRALPSTVRYAALSGVVLAATLLAVGIWVACGGGGAPPPPPAPGVSLSPTSLTFSSQNVGTTSAAQSVTLSNTGNAALSISSIAVSGTNAGDFAQTNSCGSSVAAGANCTINVTFTPTATGTRSASVAVTDNASGSPQTVPLTGTGTAPVVSLSPTSLTFSSQNVGTTSAAQSVTLTNTGNGALSISGIALSGANPGDFELPTVCSSPVAAGASCTINVTFTPTATGTRSASLAITDNAAGSPQTVTLTGTGAGPVVSLSPTSLTFSSQNVGTTSAAQSVTLSNTGNGALSISGIALSGTNPGDFAQTNNCSSPVAAGANCTINVTFKPTAAGTRSASLAITDNAAGSPQTVSLTGTGAQATPPGTYTLTVTATSGSTVHTTTITLTVQ
jgi:hypothetical protein